MFCAKVKQASHTFSKPFNKSWIGIQSFELISVKVFVDGEKFKGKEKHLLLVCSFVANYLHKYDL